MDAEQLAAVKTLFARAVELSAEERTGWLRGRGHDPEVIAEVLELCAVDEGATRVARPISAALARVAGQPPPAPGDTLGVWRLTREIGQGGMGTVFLAERSDGHFRQRAALKLLSGLPRAGSLALFSRERQLLATLTHRNIGRLLDGGATREGQPYLVMEYVEGTHVDEHCRRERLGVRSVLALFLTACDAVAFAHRRLVVHCDLKPSNLLVDGEGQPVLLDFGIARLLGQVDTGEMEAVDPARLAEVPPRSRGTSRGSTAPTLPAFTPGYASPEQRFSGTITTASDVYSLGVLLGELLEAAADWPRLPALERRELAAVVARATREDPAERYAGVETLTSDLRRFLDQRPLQALQGARGYALRKTLVRRWPWIAMAAVFLLTVSVFTFRLAGESRRAEAAERAALLEQDRAQGAERKAVRERDATRLAEAAARRERDGAERARRDSERERDRALAAERLAVRERNRARQAEDSTRESNAFLVSIFDNSNPTAESGDIPASQLIAKAEARLETELPGQDAARAELYSAMASVQANMGNPQQALANAQKALALERRQPRPLVLAQMLYLYADMVGAILSVDEEVPLAREALALRERYAPNTAAHADSLLLLGSALGIRGQQEEALRLLARSLAIHQRIDPTSLGTANALNVLGQLYSARRDFERALPAYRRGLDLRAARVGKNHPDYLDAVSSYALTLIQARHFDDAEPLLKSALAERRRLHGDDSEKVAELYLALAMLEVETGRPFAAIEHYEEVLRVHKLLQGDRSVQYAIALYNLALVNRHLGDDDLTVARIRQAIDILTPLWTDPHPGMARMRFALGYALLVLGRAEEAKAEFEKSLAARFALYGERHPDVFETETLLAECDWRSHDFAGARARLARIAGLAPGMPESMQWSFERQRAMAEALPGGVAGAAEALAEVDRKLVASGRLPRSIWWTRVYRAELLVMRGDDAEKAEGRALARQILAAMTPLVVPQSHLLTRLRELAE